MILVFDTETTGLVKDWNNGSAASNPHLVQLGFTLCQPNGRSIFTYASIIKPYYEGGIEVGAEKAHGISTEMANSLGNDLGIVMNIFIQAISAATTIIAHNLKFDKIIVEKAFKLSLHDKKQFCTMLSSTSICCLPGTRGYKWPKLEEAYDFFFSEPLKGAHDALTDVMACKRIYFDGLKMKEEGSSTPVVSPSIPVVV